MKELWLLITTPTVNALINTVLGVVIGALVTKIKALQARKKEQEEKTEESGEATNAALMALLHDRIYELAERCIVRGSISFDEFDNLTYLFTPYEKLGGNGTGKDLYAKCKNLPRRKGEAQ